jgi:hypothetical protein
MPGTRRLARFAPVVALAILAACSDGGSDDDGAASPTTTSDTTAERSADPTTTEPSEGLSEDEAGRILSDAIETTRSVDSMVVSLELSFDGGSLLGTQSVRLAGPVRLDGTEIDISAEIEEQPDAIRILISEDRAWVGGEGDDIRAALPNGADWVELAASVLQASPTYSDPSELAFLYLLNGADEIESDGEGRYRFNVDLDRAIDEAPAERREDVASTLTFSGEAEPVITGEVVLDDDGRVRSMEITGVQGPTDEEREAFDLGDDEEVTIRLLVLIDDIDVPVDVDAPDPDSVVDIADAPEVATLLQLEAG